MRSSEMCRMLASLTAHPSDLKRYLVDSDCSLYRQSYAKRDRLQGDGWGVAYYVNGVPKVVKSSNPVYEEREEFEAAVAMAASTIIITHIRRASNPRNLPMGRLIGVDNVQPFTHGRYAFAHNGTIIVVDEAEEMLGDYGRMIRGVNDSEVYFLHLMRALENGIDIEQALAGFEGLLMDIWRKVKSEEKYAEARAPYIGLNALLSDGERLYAFCAYDEAHDVGRSLCLADQPYFQMCYLADDSRLIVASEKPTKEEHWAPLKSHELLTAEIMEGKVIRKVVKIGTDV